ncbi:MAG: glycosyltransferase family 4 protein [Planctomycetes bacterium]|nr:glycosyltransferase family 4 protein [Planctomycetota bacterium]
MNGAKPPRGGEFLTYSLITNLDTDKFNPLVIYAKEGVIVKKIKQTDINTIELTLPDRLTGIYPRKIKLYSPLFLFTLLWDLVTSRCLFRLKKLILENDIQLIYCADNLSKLIGGMVGKMTNVKVVAHCHDDFKEDALGKIMRRTYLIFLDRILTVSDKVRRFFKVGQKISPKAVTVYGGIDTRLYDPDKTKTDIRSELGLDKDAFVIGSIGVIEEDKGHIYLLKAVAKLISEGIDISAVICGTGHKEEFLKKFVEDENLNENIFFPGFRKDIPEVLKALDIFVMTSMTIESLSIVTLEAMAMRNPVIATNIGGLPEVVVDGETGIIIEPCNADVLADSIKYLLENPEKRFQMGQQGRKRVCEHFTIEKNVRKTEEVFLETLGVV